MGCSLKPGNRAGGMKVVGSERSRVIVAGFRPSLPRMPAMEATGIETSRPMALDAQGTVFIDHRGGSMRYQFLVAGWERRRH